VSNGEIEVRVTEVLQKNKYSFLYGYFSHYDLSESFELVSASRDDNYWNLHQELEKVGKVVHAAEHCPERTELGRVRMYEAQRGWATSTALFAKAKN
jgi:hypothetical protein